MTTVIVDCAGCRVRGLACNDCVISTLLGVPEAGEPPVLDPDERRALGVFAASGLLPPLRLAPAKGDGPDAAGGRRVGARRHA